MIVTDIEELKKVNTDATPEEAMRIIAELEQALKASREPGVGLAAPQIGIHKRVAIVRREGVSIDLVNPVIQDMGYKFLSELEGCLSLPGIRRNVWRFEEVMFQSDVYATPTVATGFDAVVIQHECDHLDRILITDRVGTNRNDPCPCGALREGKPVKYKHCHGRF